MTTAPEPSDPVRRLATRLSTLAGWRRNVAAVLLGLGAAGSEPPFNFIPLLAIGLVGLVWILNGASTRRRAFLDGWLWGMGFFVPSLQWIAASMFVDIAQFWWMVPFSVLGLPAYVSVYVGGATLMTAIGTPRGTTWRIVGLAGWWVAGEWLRGHVLTGFPWLIAGYVWSGETPALLPVLQIASLVGVYGLSVLTVLVFSLPARLGDAASLQAKCWSVGWGAALLAACWIWGSARLSGGPDPTVPGARIRILSSAIPHRAEYDPAQAAADFRDVVRLATSPGLDQVRAEIWPEGEVDAALNRDAPARAAIAAAAPPGGVVITGAIREAGSGHELQAWNDVFIVTSSGEVAGTYDKHHLVPFGEYVPLHWLLNFSQIAAQRFDFSTGPGPLTLAVPGLPEVGPIVCYEAIFPGDVVDEQHRPSWMVNVSDDGWFGESIGPRQHFAIARVRAVEEGLPLVRSTNGGISGLIDAHGRIVATSMMSQPGVMDVELPQAIPNNTFYAFYGNKLPVISVVLAIFAGVLGKKYFT